MTQAENWAEPFLNALTEKAPHLSLKSGKRHGCEEITADDYLTKLYALKRSILEDERSLFTRIMATMKPAASVYPSCNESQKSQIQLVVADLLHDSISMTNRECYIPDLSNIFDMNGRNKLGFIPLHLAVGRGKFEVVSKLVRYGSNVNLQNDQGRSPLHIAVFKGHSEITNYLLSHGANIDVTDGEKWTPLHWACRNHQIEMVRLLILNRARLDKRTNKGLTPLDMSLTVSPAPRQWHPMTAWNLVVHGANQLSPSCFHQWLTEVLPHAQMPAKFQPVVSQLLLLFARAGLITSAQLDEALPFLAPDDLEEARRFVVQPWSLAQLTRLRVRALLARGANDGRSYVQDVTCSRRQQLGLPESLIQFVLLKV